MHNFFLSQIKMYTLINGRFQRHDESGTATIEGWDEGILSDLKIGSQYLLVMYEDNVRKEWRVKVLGCDQRNEGRIHVQNLDDAF